MKHCYPIFERYKMTPCLLFLNVTNSSLPPRECYYPVFSGQDYPLLKVKEVSESPAMSRQCSVHHIGQAPEHWKAPPQDGLPKKEKR